VVEKARHNTLQHKPKKARETFLSSFISWKNQLIFFPFLSRNLTPSPFLCYNVTKGGFFMPDTKLARLLIRIHTLLGNDNPIHDRYLESDSKIDSKLINLTKKLNSSFRKNGITLYQTLIETAINEEICVVYALCLIYEKEHFRISDDLFRDFCETIGISPSCEPPTIRFAYIGRQYDCNRNQVAFTEGLQREEPNDILFDFFSHMSMGIDNFIFWLVHELLHVVGMKENEVHGNEKHYLELSYKLLFPFAQKVFSKIPYCYNDFVKRVEKVQQQNQDAFEEIKDIAAKLNDFGFPISADSICIGSALHAITCKKNQVIAF
jgi:hypothetical protein